MGGWREGGRKKGVREGGRGGWMDEWMDRWIARWIIWLNLKHQKHLHSFIYRPWLIPWST